MNKSHPRKGSIFTDISNAIYRKRLIIIFTLLVSLAVFFSVEFFLLQNWDMLVRILNANFLFHNGIYFENQRALLESFLIGLFGFVFGGYAVYAFIALATIIFFISLYMFSEAFRVKYLFVVLVVLSPFLILYGMKNGSELLMFSFLIMFISMIRFRDPLAGIFLALAFVSKYDSLLFLPLTVFFLIDKNIRRGVINFFSSIAIFLATLIPYFVYNYVVYHNIIYTFAESLFRNGSGGNILATNANTFQYGPSGFLELIVIGVIVFFLIISNRKRLSKRIKLDRDRIFDISLLSVGAIISLVIYFGASHLFYYGIGVYRFFLGVLLFLTLITALFLRKIDLAWLLPFAVVSIIIAIIMLSNMYPLLYIQSAVNRAITAFHSIYNTTNCTVESNEWVLLDYYGLPSTYYPRSDVSGLPIVNIGLPANTSLPLLYNQSGIYIYGGKTCNYIPPEELPNGYYAEVNESIKNSTLPCYWLFDSSFKSPTLLKICVYLT